MFERSGTSLEMKYAVSCFLLLVAACHKEQPPAPTAEQNLQLNEAAAMLNALGNQEGPADRSTGPSNSTD
jgi:hypothetical protein